MIWTKSAQFSKKWPKWYQTKFFY